LALFDLARPKPQALTPEDLNTWRGREAGGQPVYMATGHLDLFKQLNPGLAFVRQQKKL